MRTEELKNVVKKKYGGIARQSSLLSSESCCGETACCGDIEFSMIGDEYKNMPGYNPNADLGLGCGIPTEFAGIKEGDNVLDLGSGAGNDVFVARSFVGDSGTVTGLDFSEEMLGKANVNLERSGFKNIQFIYGDIDNIPLPDNTFDVVISNCVLNLVPDKQKAFAEIFRVLKPDGHFCVSDVVLKGELPAGIREASEMYAGCVAGALQKDDYLEIIRQLGFSGVTIHKEKSIPVPDSVLDGYLSEKEIEEYKKSDTGIFSITVTAKK